MPKRQQQDGAAIELTPWRRAAATLFGIIITCFIWTMLRWAGAPAGVAVIFAAFGGTAAGIVWAEISRPRVITNIDQQGRRRQPGGPYDTHGNCQN